MTKQQQIQDLKDKLDALTTNNEDLKKQLNKVVDDYVNRQMFFQNVSDSSDGVSQVPFDNINLLQQKMVQQPFVNVNMSIAVKDSIYGISTMSGGNDWIAWLFVLERARYFKSCVVFKCLDDKLVKCFYEALYYGSLNGSIGIVKEDDNYFLVYLKSVKYDKFGRLKKVEAYTFNYFMSTDFEIEDYEFSGDRLNNIVIFRFNNDNFGLWVLTWWYLKEIVDMLNILLNQTQLLNKKFVYEGEVNSQIKSDIISAIKSKSVVIWLRKGQNLKELNNPEIDVSQIFNLIQDTTNYFDFHILGIRTKDISSDKPRDVASQQLNQQIVADNKDMYIDYWIEDTIFQIREKWNIDISFQNRNISLSDDIKDKSETINKINDNSGDNYE